MSLNGKMIALAAMAAVLSGIGAAGAAAPEVVVVAGGKSAFRIGLEADAVETERFAAAELQKYLKAMSGVMLPIIQATGRERNLILIRAMERPVVPRVPIPPKEDSFLIRVGPGGIRLIGQTPRAALYAVYAFLEQVGCRWFAPGYEFYRPIGSEEIPRKTRVAVPVQNLREAPLFLYRKKYVEEGHSHTTENLKQLIDWMAKARMNVFNCPVDYGHRGRVVWDNWRKEIAPECRKRGIIIEVGGHGYQNYLRQEEHFDRHPDWFGMIDGRRSRSPNLVFNTANPEAMDALAAEVVRYLKARPEIRIFDLWPPDGARWSNDRASEAQGPRRFAPLWC